MAPASPASHDVTPYTSAASFAAASRCSDGTAGSRLGNLRSAAASLRSSVLDTLLGSADITQLGTTNPLGLVTGLRRTDRNLARLHSGLTTLAKRGLDPELISQLASLGLAALPEVLRLTTASSGTIHTRDRLEHTAERRARDIARFTAQTVYGPRIDALRHDIRDLRHEQRETNKLLKELRKDTQHVGADTAGALNTVARSAHHRRGGS